MWTTIVSGIIIGIIIHFGLKHYEKLGLEKNKEMERENEKKDIVAGLLSEIKSNQTRLKPLSESADKIIIMSMSDWCIVIGSHYDKDKKGKLPNMLKFDKNIYFSLSNKLWVLDDNCRNKLVSYYSEFKYIEDEFNKLDIKDGSYSHLVYPMLRDYDKSISKSKWDEIDSFLRKTKKEYNLGEELVNDLNAFACVLN